MTRGLHEHSPVCLWTPHTQDQRTSATRTRQFDTTQRLHQGSRAKTNQPVCGHHTKTRRGEEHPPACLQTLHTREKTTVTSTSLFTDAPHTRKDYRVASTSLFTDAPHTRKDYSDIHQPVYRRSTHKKRLEGHPPACLQTLHTQEKTRGTSTSLFTDAPHTRKD